MIQGSTHRFICDDHLGKLARYLRVCGYDTAYKQNCDNSELLNIALTENRHILTRDTRLIALTLVRDYTLIKADNWAGQLKQVVSDYCLIIEISRLFSRCLEDNTPTIEVDKRMIRYAVYPYTYEHHNYFRQCPKCKRVYWSGSHVEAMLERLKSVGIL